MCTFAVNFNDKIIFDYQLKVVIKKPN